MDLLLILTYTAICYAIFKILKIPVNKWTVPTAALGGIVLVSSLVLLMSYNHPFTNEGRIYFTSAPVIPSVRGPVIEVPVTSNVPLKKGDVLFRIDPRPYQFAVDEKRAALAEAEQNVRQLNSASTLPNPLWRKGVRRAIAPSNPLTAPILPMRARGAPDDHCQSRSWKLKIAEAFTLLPRQSRSRRRRARIRRGWPTSRRSRVSIQRWRGCALN